MFNKRKKAVTLSKPRKQFLDKCIKKAQKMLPSKKQISKTIKKARNRLDRLRNLPKCDTVIKNVCNFCDLLSDYLDGTYQAIPLATIAACLAGLIYLVSPLDAISDLIPFFGLLDDAAVLAFIIAAEQNDINEYLAWKETHVLVTNT